MAAVHEDVLDVARDDVGAYKLVKFHTKTQFDPFVAVFVQREHVSLYVVPLARDTSIALDLPAELRTRQTGKGTFRFKTEDDPALAHVPELFETCLMTWVDEGLIR
tara:strand:- start:748 stop:1065 length:318 start_codon:yes stop_codon:yes gene_type:complete